MHSNSCTLSNQSQLVWDIAQSMSVMELLPLAATYPATAAAVAAAHLHFLLVLCCAVHPFLTPTPAATAAARHITTTAERC
jgi:hypothetical protein